MPDDHRAGLPDGDLALDVCGTVEPVAALGEQRHGRGDDGGEGRGRRIRRIPTTGDGAITAINGRFFLQAADAKHGTELWQSNGTVAGTTLVQDINPGKGSSYP